MKKLTEVFGFDAEAARAEALAFGARRMALALLWARGVPQGMGIERDCWIESMSALRIEDSLSFAP